MGENSCQLTNAIGSSGMIRLPIPTRGLGATPDCRSVQASRPSPTQVMYPFSLFSGSELSSKPGESASSRSSHHGTPCPAHRAQPGCTHPRWRTPGRSTGTTPVGYPSSAMRPAGTLLRPIRWRACIAGSRSSRCLSSCRGSCSSRRTGRAGGTAIRHLSTGIARRRFAPR